MRWPHYWAFAKSAGAHPPPVGGYPRGNTATGDGTLFNVTTGDRNTAVGHAALNTNTTGRKNTAVGSETLLNNITGTNNIALGYSAGIFTVGNNNINIGNDGVVEESDTICIGTANGRNVRDFQRNTYIAGISGVTIAAGVSVIIDADGHLGSTTSSERFKDEVKPMNKTSEAILALKPVTYRYKKAIDPAGTPQFGLVAEDVEKVNPDLVVRDKDGKPYSVRYDQVNAMLLNEFLKEHRKVEELRNDFRATVAQQQKEIQALTARLEKEAAQLQQVSTQIQVGKPVPQLVQTNE